MSTRRIIHVDLDAFYASVEELLDPSIAGKPILVGGSPEGRGVVSSASYAARAYGIHSAMPMGQALRLCAHAVIRPGNMKRYVEYSQRVRRICEDYTPLVEPISIDEAFLDVTGCQTRWGSGEQVGRLIQERISVELGLPASFGIASNKLVAKIACSLGKPRGLLVVPPGEEAAFLAPLPVDALWGVGTVTAQSLRDVGIETIGQLARLPQDHMESHFGTHGESILRRAKGMDDAPVSPSRPVKSISHEHTFSRDVCDWGEMERHLLRMCDRVSERLRHKGLAARTVTVKIRYSDFSTITRRATLEEATDIPDIFHREAIRLLHRACQGGALVRLLGVGVSGLMPASRQLTFLGDRDETQRRLRELNRVLDAIREKHGSRAIRRASLLHRPGSEGGESAL